MHFFNNYSRILYEEMIVIMNDSLKIEFQNFLNELNIKTANLFRTEETFRKYMLLYLDRNGDVKDNGYRVIYDRPTINKGIWLYDTRIEKRLKSGKEDVRKNAENDIIETFHMFLKSARNGR